jgi:hypothetical protein
MERPFVPPGFVPPLPPAGDGVVLTPLLVEHNQDDLRAWSSSVAHIHATPGFEQRRWPDEPMTLARNEADLQAHVDDFAAGRGFTYTVLSDPGGEVVGCLYIYPSPVDDVDTHVRSWVTADRAELDGPLYRLVRHWLDAEWPFATDDYAPRADA